MSVRGPVIVSPVPLDSSAAGPRKRTSSFSTPRPEKAPRMTLKRTVSYATLPGLESRPAASSSVSKMLPLSGQPQPMPGTPSTSYTEHTPRNGKELRGRRKLYIDRTCGNGTLKFTGPQPHATPRATPSPAAPAPPPPSPQSAAPESPPGRASSPLAPTRTPLPPRTPFPRSKAQPDLYRVAIRTRMRGTPEGQKILNMGPRLALSIMTATRELERMVAAQAQTEMQLDRERDCCAQLGNSWVFVPGEDWEMVDCSA